MGQGRLSGDTVVRCERSAFYFHLATFLVPSVLFSLVLRFVQRWGR